MATEKKRPPAWAAWLTVVLVTVGFIVGGTGLTLHRGWWLFWVGVGIVAVGIVFGGAMHIMEYTEEYEQQERIEPGTRRVHG